MSKNRDWIIKNSYWKRCGEKKRTFKSIQIFFLSENFFIFFLYVWRAFINSYKKMKTFIFFLQVFECLLVVSINLSVIPYINLLFLFCCSEKCGFMQNSFGLKWKSFSFEWKKTLFIENLKRNCFFHESWVRKALAVFIDMAFWYL